MTFDHRLRQLRLERGLTLAQLAAKTGIRCATLSHLERGLQPSIPNIARLAAALDLDVEELATPVLRQAVANSISSTRVTV